MKRSRTGTYFSQTMPALLAALVLGACGGETTVDLTASSTPRQSATSTIQPATATPP